MLRNCAGLEKGPSRQTVESEAVGAAQEQSDAVGKKTMNLDLSGPFARSRVKISVADDGLTCMKVGKLQLPLPAQDLRSS
jgi:hypothetical protein